MKSPKDLLGSFELRHTSTREEVLQAFLKHPEALSQHDIETELPPSHDRITVYRTIKTFLDKGLVHKILDDSGTLKYALCTERCSHGEHNHDHLHFKCEVCKKTTCIENTKIPEIPLPAGYLAQELNVLIHGVCKNCN
jgi:Fur family transcriptional regulator, ferric uptake regulator